MDKRAQADARLGEAQSRMLRRPVGDQGISSILPAASALAGKVLGFDGSGEPIAGELDDFTGNTIAAYHVIANNSSGAALPAAALPETLNALATDTTTRRTLGARLADKWSVKDFGGDLAACVTAASTDKKTIVVDTAVTLTADLTVPETVTLEFTRDGSVAGSYTLTLEGPIGAGLYQIFETGLTAVLERVEAVYPQWWGAQGDGATEDSAAFTAAEATGNVVVVPNGTYVVNDTGYGSVFVHNGDATVSGTNDLVLRERHTRRYKSTVKYPSEIVSAMSGLLPDIYETASGYKVDFDPKTRRPVRALTYYVDPQDGDDTNSGTAETAAFATLAHALSLPGDKDIILAPARYDLAEGWNENDITAGVTVRCSKGRATLTTELKAREWVEDGSYPGLYVAPTVSGTEDWAAITTFFAARVDAETFPLGVKLTSKALATLQGGAVGISIGAVNTYVRLPGDRKPTAALVARKYTTNVKATFTTAEDLYLENLDIDFGLTNAVRVVCSTACNITLVNVKVTSAFADDGVYISNPGTTVTWGCEVCGNWTDGISYHGSATTKVLEYKCIARYNGQERGGQNNNGTTLHDGAIIRVGTIATDNQNRNCHDVGMTGPSYSFNVGCTFRGSMKDDAGFAVDFGSATGGTPQGVIGWLVDCDVDTVEVLGALAEVKATVDTTYTDSSTVDGGTLTTDVIL